jgi:outer membrane protein TolC
MNRLILPRIQIAQTILLLGALAPVAHGQIARSDSTVRLSLSQAILLAAKQNPTVEGAQTRVEAARARVVQRKAELLPDISAVAREYGSTINSATFPLDLPAAPGQKALFDPRGEILGPVNVFDARARVSQKLYDPAARTRVTSARTGVSAASADVLNTADVAATSAANAYIAVLRADAVYSARLADSTLAAELLGIAQSQLQAGTGIALDVTRARSQLVSSRAQLIVARNERDRTRVDLGRALGFTNERIQVVDSLGSLPLAAAVNEATAESEANKNRKDLLALSLQAQASRQAAEAIRNERLPSVGLFADQGQSQRNGRSYLPTYDWGVQLSVPIFDGFRREGRVEEQLAQAHELDVRKRDVHDQVIADIRTATLNLRSSTEQVAAARERLSLAEQEVAQARERFQAGVASNADVITASLTLTTARTQLVDALGNYQFARVALARAEGSITSLQ